MELKRAKKGSEITGETPRQSQEEPEELRSLRALNYAMKEVELNQQIFERFQKKAEKFQEDVDRYLDWIEDKLRELLDQEEPAASQATDLIGAEIQALKARVYRLEKITGIAKQPETNQTRFSPRG